MKYFRQHLSPDARSDSLDISVHCDVKVFEWLMAYVEHKHGAANVKGTLSAEPSTRDPPKLNLKNVVSVLISSHFLQMDDLMEVCLQYVFTHINSIVKRQANLNCINNDLLTRLASRFTFREFHTLVDKKDKLASKLYWKHLELIFSVDQPLHDLYRCSHCMRLLLPGDEEQTQCLDDRLRVDHAGRLVYCHEVDRSWDVNEFLAGLRIDGMAPAEIYWRVQGYAYRLSCSRCSDRFAASELKHCRYHPRSPEFKNDSAPSAGVYPCCEQQVLRFEPAQMSDGCAFREHSPQMETDEEKEFLELLRKHHPTALLDTTDPAALRRITHSESSHPLNPSTPMHRLRYLPSASLVGEDEDDVDDIPEPSTPRVVVKHRVARGRTMTTAETAALRTELRSAFLAQTASQQTQQRKTPVMFCSWSPDQNLKANLDTQRMEDTLAMRQMIASISRLANETSGGGDDDDEGGDRGDGGGRTQQSGGRTRRTSTSSIAGANGGSTSQHHLHHHGGVTATRGDPPLARRGSAQFRRRQHLLTRTSSTAGQRGHHGSSGSSGGSDRAVLAYASDGLFARVMQRGQRITAEAEAAEKAERARAQRQHSLRRLSRRQSLARVSQR